MSLNVNWREKETMILPDWENCRRPNGTIDLRKAAHWTGCRITEQGDAYLVMVERMARITSRQIAAVAIATALDISARSE
jgi:hypothetical protein